jgi:integrase
MAAIGAGTMEPVFPSGTLGWRHPSNVQRSVRRLRVRIGYPDFKTHVGRKTVAPVLAEAGQSSRQIADQLRQSSIQTTEKHYIERGILNPGAAKLIDANHNGAV